jgi:xanthine dehydrogenase YagT iron-sulfur-binding subunit
MASRKEMAMAEDQDATRATRRVTRRGFLVGGSTAAAAVVATGLIEAPTAEAQAASEVDPALGLTTVRMHVNGTDHVVNVESRWTLLEVLRDKLGLTGTKLGCDRAECGACTVVMNGAAVYSCSQLALWADGADITTVEGLARGDDLHPIQQAFQDLDAGQCYYCIPGQIMAAKALLDANPDPTPADARTGLSGNLCRCANYNHIQAAVLQAGRLMRGEVAS